MTCRRYAFWSVLLLVPTPVRTAQPAAQAPAPPTVIVRVASLDTLLESGQLLAGLAGKEEVARQFHAMIMARVGPNGLEGVDPKRPIGAYVRFGNQIDEVHAVAMLPVRDEKALLALLESFNLNVKKGKNDIYTVATGTPVDVHFRFANQYAYVTALNVDALAKENLAEPAKIFAGGPAATLSLSVRLDHLPDAAKTLATAFVEEKLHEIQNLKAPGETPAQHAVKVAALQEVAQTFKDVLHEAAELTVQANIDGKAKEVTTELSLTAQPNSKLAGRIAGLAHQKSIFPIVKTAAAQAHIHLSAPDLIAKALQAVIDQELAKGLNQIDDEGLRKQAQALLEAAMPTLKAAELDAGLLVGGPGTGGHFHALVGVKLREGERLGQTIREIANTLLPLVPDAERDKIKLDAETAGGIKIHRIDAQSHFDEKARKIFGDHPVYVAFRNDAAFVAVGDGGLVALKTALASTPTARPPLTLEVNPARLAPLIAQTDAQKDIVRKVFPPGEDGTVRLSVEGGNALRARFSARFSALQFLGLALQIKEGPGN